jgi:hypothetical protein
VELHDETRITAVDYARLIHAVRLDLEQAGNPAFMVVVVDGGQGVHLTPVVYSTVYAAADHARRVMPGVEPDDTVLVVTRQAQGLRAQFTVLDPARLKRLHEQSEVVERSFADEDYKL